MADDSLQRRRYAALLLVHGRCALSSRSLCCLRVQIAWLLCVVDRLHRLRGVHHWRHLLCIDTLIGIWRRRRYLWCRAIHRVVHWLGLHRRLLAILIHLHGLHGRGSLGLHLSCLLGLCLLLAHRLGLLLLLYTGCRRMTAGSSLEIHWWHKRAGELLLCDEGMHLGLLWRPSLKGIQIE